MYIWDVGVGVGGGSSNVRSKRFPRNLDRTRRDKPLSPGSCRPITLLWRCTLGVMISVIAQSSAHARTVPMPQVTSVIYANRTTEDGGTAAERRGMQSGRRQNGKQRHHVRRRHSMKAAIRGPPRDVSTAT